MKHNWQYKKLGEICEILNGFAFKSSNYVSHGGIRVIRIANVQDGYISDEAPQFYPIGEMHSLGKYLLYENDLLMSLTGNVGRVALLSKDLLPAALNQRVACLRPSRDINKKFLFHFLHNSLFVQDCIKAAKGVAQLNMSTEWLKEFPIPLPPLEEQQLIVAELDRINAVIEDCRQLLRTLDALAQSLFYDSFGDTISNPKAWPTQPLKQVAPASSSKAEPEESNGKFWLLNLDQVESNSGRIIEKQFFSIQEIGASTVLFDENNVLYSKLRPYLNKVVIPNGRGYCTSELIPLKPNNLLKEYLAYSLRLPEFVQYISGKTGGAKMPRVKMNYFWDFQLPVPPLELQQQFARRIESIEAQKKEVEKTIATLQTLLDSRMDYWFN